MRYENVTVGGDFEYFLVNPVNGSPFPACGLIGGTKDKPRPMGEKDYLITEDNVMVEFNIPPATTSKMFGQYVEKGFYMSHKYIPPSLAPCVKATMEFDPQWLQMIPQAMVFGCEPDYNAWQETKNPRPDSNVTFRSAAGHVHIGYSNPDQDATVELIKACDIFLGLPSVWEDPDRVRRTLYGKSGAFRFKPYGGEYRVLGNYWIEHAVTASSIFTRVMKAVDFLNKGGTIKKGDADLIQQAINTYDQNLAEKLYMKYDK